MTNHSSRYLAAQTRLEQTTAQRYRDTLNNTVGDITRPISPRTLDDGCQACNMSKVYCDAIWYQFNRACCGMCGHP